MEAITSNKFTTMHLVAEVAIMSGMFYYFNKKIRWQSHYIPKDNVLRGGQLFDKYFSVKFDLLEEAIQNISCNQEFIKIFDDIIEKIKNI